MKNNINKSLIAFFVLVICLFAAESIAAQQTDSKSKKPLESPAIVKGYIGGEAHDGYVIRAKKGQTLSISISWEKEEDNRAEFSVSRSSNFFDGELVKFGTESNGGKNWSGKILKGGDHYIYVVAHPSAKYTLSVELR